MKKALFLLLLLLCAASYAQNLPAGFATGEQQQMPFYLQEIQSANSTRGIVTPPPYPNLRTAAEWEEIQTLVITWTTFTAIHREIVRNARTQARVSIICSDSTAVKNFLTAGGVALSNISYIIAPYNSIWMRDYGANTVYGNNVDSLFLVDWIYNRPRPKDDTVPGSLARFLNLKLYETKQPPYNLVHTGGNFMSDGFGTAFSSQLTDSENPGHSAAGIDTIMKKFMGIDRYIRFPVLPYDGIHHIDMHMKLLDEETLIVGKYPTGVSDGPQIEANLQYILSNFNSVYGTPYKVIRIPMPPDQYGDYPSQNGDYLTYTNAVFVNKMVILPTYYAQYDTTALRIWREALPGYSIIGIDCDNGASNIISQSGAIHCITHSIGVSDPLLISHQRLSSTCDTTNPFAVNATIMHRSGISSATLYYTNDTLLGYQPVPMNLINAANNTWSAMIPPQTNGTDVFYYIQASAVSGKTINRPIAAPAGYWRFKIACSPVGIASGKPSIGFKDIYPNPASAITCIPMEFTQSSSVILSIKDMLGKTIRQVYAGEAAAGEKNFFIDASSFPDGLYLVEAKGESGIVTKKLLIRK